MCSFVACGKSANVDDYDPVHIVSMEYGSDNYLSGSSSTLRLYLSDETNNSYTFNCTIEPQETASWKDLSVTYDSKVVSIKDGVVTAKGVGDTTIVIKARKGQFKEGVDTLTVNVKVTNPYYYAGGSYYNDMGDIATAVGNGSNVKLLRDAEINGLAPNKSLTLDLNNHKLTTSNTITLQNDYNYTIQNGQITSSKSVIYNEGKLTLKNVTLTTTGDQTTVVNSGKLTLNDSTVTSQNGVAVLVDSTDTSYIGCLSDYNANTGLSLNGKPALKVVQGRVYVGNPTINNGNQSNQILVLTNTKTGDLYFKVNTQTSLKVKIENATEDFKEQDVTIENNGNAIFDYGTINLVFEGQVGNTLALRLTSPSTANGCITIRPKTPVNFLGKIVYEFNNNDRFQFQDLKGELATISKASSGSYDSYIELDNTNGIMMTWSGGGEDECPNTFVILANYIENNKETQQIVITVTIDTSASA